MSTHNLKIKSKGTKPQVEIDGKDITQHVSRLDLVMEAECVPRVILTVPILDGVEIEAEVITKILEEKYERRTAENAE